MAFQLALGCDILGRHRECCTCCAFSGGFHYADADVLGSVCILQLTVTNLQSGCVPLNVGDATITIVLEVNGTTITDALIYDTDLNIIFWQKWKPVAGDVYTADVELDCGYETFSRSYSYTIPDPANLGCTCCDDRTPDFVTISGLTGNCCTPGNGTFVMSAYDTCVWESVVEYTAPDTVDKCNAAVACDATTLGNGDIFYRHIASVLVRVGIGVNPLTLVALADSNEIRVFIRVSHYGYLRRFSDGVCADDDGGASEWVFSSICAPTPLDLYSTGGSNFCTGTPTVELALV